MMFKYTFTLEGDTFEMTKTVSGPYEWEVFALGKKVKYTILKIERV